MLAPLRLTRNYKGARRLFHLPRFHAHGIIGLELYFQAHAGGRDRFETDRVVGICADGVSAGGLNRLPLLAILVEEVPRDGNGASAGGYVLIPINLGLRNRGRLGEAVFDPIIRALLSAAKAGPPVEMTLAGAFRIVPSGHPADIGQRVVIIGKFNAVGGERRGGWRQTGDRLGIVGLGARACAGKAEHHDEKEQAETNVRMIYAHGFVRVRAMLNQFVKLAQTKTDRIIGNGRTPALPPESGLQAASISQ